MMSADALVERLRAHVLAAGLFTRRGRALLAVSGGPDSLVMLWLLHELADDLGLSLAVGHTDHGIHADSAAWARHVETCADRLKLPYLARRLQLGAAATETAARRARYAALRAMQAEWHARYLVTGHHADDQVETVLYRLLRGAGPAGLAGIPPRGPHGLRRPLLPFRREELHAWLRRVQPDVHPVRDPANEDTAHERVWVRRVVLPLLRSRMPDADRAVLRSAAHAAEDRGAWEALLVSDLGLGLRRVDGVFEVERAPFLEYDNMLSVALLRAFCRLAGRHLDYRRAHTLARFVTRASSGRRFDLGRGWLAETAFGRLRILPPSIAAGAEGTLAAVAWGEGDTGSVRWGGWRLRWRWETAGRIRRTGWTTWLRHPGEARAYRSGDRIRPLGGVGRRAVRRLLMEARVPLAQRRTHPVVVRDQEVLWIPGVCRSEAEVPRRGERAVRLDVRRLSPVGT